MAIEVRLPKLGTTMLAAVVDRWLKSEGEEVLEGEDLFEITTDKVEAAIPSPASGTLSQVLVQGGEEVQVGTVLAIIEQSA